VTAIVDPKRGLLLAMRISVPSAKLLFVLRTVLSEISIFYFANGPACADFTWREVSEVLCYESPDELNAIGSLPKNKRVVNIFLPCGGRRRRYPGPTLRGWVKAVTGRLTPSEHRL
jgi:hypothetical protein